MVNREFAENSLWNKVLVSSSPDEKSFFKLCRVGQAVSDDLEVDS